MDPITIGLAFTAAQTAVSHIKQAIALGKDINSLAGQFSKFFDASDAVHRAKIQNKLKASKLGKTDAELGREALQIAMHSDSLREQERQLKDMIIWQLGKPQIWEQMIKERTRLFKERAAAEAAALETERKRKQKVAEQFMFAMYFIGFAIFLFAFAMGGIAVYGVAEEKRIYEQKVLRVQQQRAQQQRARQAEEKAAGEKAANNGG
jgi:hypothetical protein